MKKIALYVLVIFVTLISSETIFPQEKEAKSKDLTYAVFPYEFVSEPSTQNARLPEILRDAFSDKLKLDAYELINNEIIDSVLAD